LPHELEGIRTCARLFGYAAAEPFLDNYRSHTSQVSRVFEKFVGRQ